MTRQASTPGIQTSRPRQPMSSWWARGPPTRRLLLRWHPNLAAASAQGNFRKGAVLMDILTEKSQIDGS